MPRKTFDASFTPLSTVWWQHDIEKNEKESNKLNASVQKLLDIIADDDTLTELNKLQKYQEGIERNMIKAEKEIEFYEQNDMCGTCNQELSEDHKTKMISVHHGKMHESGTALMSLSHKIEDVKSQLDEVNNCLLYTSDAADE